MPPQPPPCGRLATGDALEKPSLYLPPFPRCPARPVTRSDFRSSPWVLVLAMAVLALVVLTVRTATGW